MCDPYVFLPNYSVDPVLDARCPLMLSKDEVEGGVGRFPIPACESHETEESG